MAKTQAKPTKSTAVARKPRKAATSPRKPRYQYLDEMARKRAADKQKFLDTFIEVGFFLRACITSGVASTSVRRWETEDEDFKAALAECRESVIEEQEWTLRECSLGRRTLTPPQVTCLIFALKANRPDKYRERYEFTGSNGGPIEVRTIEIVKSYGNDDTVP